MLTAARRVLRRVLAWRLRTPSQARRCDHCYGRIRGAGALGTGLCGSCLSLHPPVPPCWRCGGERVVWRAARDRLGCVVYGQVDCPVCAE